MKFKVITLVTLIGISVFMVNCGSSGDRRNDATTVGENAWYFEGWACAPMASKKDKESPAEYCEGRSEKDLDYLYMKMSAAASDNAIKSGRITQKRATCVQAAEDQVKGNGLSKIIGDYIESTSGVADGQSTGFAIVRETQGRIKGVGIYNCCSVNAETGRCVEKDAAEEWEQCMCVGYIRFPGGQKGFQTMAEKAQSN